MGGVVADIGEIVAGGGVIGGVEGDLTGRTLLGKLRLDPANQTVRYCMPALANLPE